MAEVDSVNGKSNNQCEHAGVGQDSPILGTVALLAAAVFGYCVFNIAKQLAAGLKFGVNPITR
ncbi:MAG: hypothetical protein H7A40_05780 [Chlamydiales bacterium]|nr:hypothetical protein [Chlamydiales bacterium]